MSFSISSAFNAVNNTISTGIKRYGKDALEIGAVAAAGTAGFLVAGPVGAAVAGGLAGSAVSAIDQKVTTGHIDPAKVALSGAISAVPIPAGRLAVGAVSKLAAPAVEKGVQALAKEVAPPVINRFAAGYINTTTKRAATTAAGTVPVPGNPFAKGPQPPVAKATVTAKAAATVKGTVPAKGTFTPPIVKASPATLSTIGKTLAAPPTPFHKSPRAV